MAPDIDQGGPAERPPSDLEARGLTLALLLDGPNSKLLKDDGENDPDTVHALEIMGVAQIIVAEGQLAAMDHLVHGRTIIPNLTTGEAEAMVQAAHERLAGVDLHAFREEHFR
ncbi:MAG TPA: hypothetical protein VK674_04880 [Candidatus Limnocylindria bacterium]|nr:hypothetical protein [Candidatus Limnocylindria bacterium]